MTTPRLAIVGDTLAITLDNGFTISTGRDLAGQILVDAATAPLGARVAPARRLDATTPPRLGQYWQGQGGIYVGSIRGENGAPDYHLIAAVGPEAELSLPWGVRGKDIAGAQHDRDGLLNTRAMADAGSDLAKQLIELEHDGHNDWYLPAKQELALCWMNTEDVFAKAWHWSSTQYSAHDAFCQGFGDGDQSGGDKDYLYRARAVRRFVIQ